MSTGNPWVLLCGYCGYRYSVRFADLHQHHTHHRLPTGSATRSHTYTHEWFVSCTTSQHFNGKTLTLSHPTPSHPCCLEPTTWSQLLPTILSLSPQALLPSPALHSLACTALSPLPSMYPLEPHHLYCSGPESTTTVSAVMAAEYCVNSSIKLILHS